MHTFDTALDLVIPGTEIPLETSGRAGIVSPVIAVAPRTHEWCFRDLGAIFADTAFDAGTVLGACAAEGEALKGGWTKASRVREELGVIYQRYSPSRP